ncbi:uncharacterized protein LOC101784309 isoform X1 [Setaria italica]|uniref:uncharacterized protein LOC101784309 isoform X1 n=1 Tax=Setaria italica TaxID=4555 RepID=UPI0006455FC9|nr:uncharacterized protein LOC101784309 isoform X1 [Setaria italica]
MPAAARPASAGLLLLLLPLPSPPRFPPLCSTRSSLRALAPAPTRRSAAVRARRESSPPSPPAPADSLDCVGTASDVECFVDAGAEGAAPLLPAPLARRVEGRRRWGGRGGSPGLPRGLREGALGVGVPGVALLLLGHGHGGHEGGHPPDGALLRRRAAPAPGRRAARRLSRRARQEAALRLGGVARRRRVRAHRRRLLPGLPRGGVAEDVGWARECKAKSKPPVLILSPQVIIDSQPLTVAILASLLFGESIGAIGAGGLVLGVAGLLLLEVPALSLEGNDATIWGSGEWLMFLSAQSMAVGTIMVRWVSKYSDPIMATGWHMIIGGLPLLVISVLNRDPALSGHIQELTWSDILALGYTSVFGSAISYGVYFYNATRGSLTTLSSLTFLTPMFASIFGYLYLGETFSPVQIGGALLTLVAIYMVNYRSIVGEK